MATPLSAYGYTIKYKSRRQQNNAAALSIFPLADMPASVSTPAETVEVMELLSTIPLKSADCDPS